MAYLIVPIFSIVIIYYLFNGSMGFYGLFYFLEKGGVIDVSEFPGFWVLVLVLVLRLLVLIFFFYIFIGPCVFPSHLN